MVRFGVNFTIQAIHGVIQVKLIFPISRNRILLFAVDLRGFSSREYFPYLCL